MASRLKLGISSKLIFKGVGRTGFVDFDERSRPNQKSLKNIIMKKPEA